MDWGQVSPFVVISPHLDDGVFSCGDLLARHPGQSCLTVFAGGPRPAGKVTAWDSASGFKAGEDVVSRRRAEDQFALRLLKAKPYWLDFWDSQYGSAASPQDIAEILDKAIDDLNPSAVFFPVGLYHSDHQLTSDACLLLSL